MRAPFSFVIASACLTVALVGSAPNQAWAQKKKVVVEQFKGPAADKYRVAVMKSIYASGIDVVPDKTLVKLEADLGLQRVADAYPGVARELKLSGYVSGIITGGRRPKARVIVRDATGKPIGGEIFQATSAPKLMQMVAAGSGPKVAAVLGGGGGPVPPEPVAEADLPAPPAKGGKAAAAEAEAEPEPAAEPEEKPTRKGKKVAKKDEEGDADAELAAGADEEVSERKKAGTGKGLHIAGVLRTFSRNFAYNDNKKGAQQGYQAPESKFNNLPLVPAPGLAVQFNPTSSLGVFATYNKAIIGSKDSAGSIYTTTAYSYSLGAEFRLPMSSFEIVPSAAFSDDVFRIDPFANKENNLQVAPVDYKALQLGGGIRIPMSGGGAFNIGGHYLYLMSTGDIISDKYFKGSAVGGQLEAGITIPLQMVKGLDFTVAGDFRRIAFAFTPDKSAMRIAGGAVDQYVGLNLALGYNLGL